MAEPAIVLAIQRYHPEWEPPEEYPGGDWTSCLCPFHDDTRKSACVSYKFDAYFCFACPARGGIIKLIRTLEGVSYREAIRIAEELSEGSDAAVPPSALRKSRRRVPGDSGACVRLIDTRDNPQVPTRFRRKPPRWT